MTLRSRSMVFLHARSPLRSRSLTQFSARFAPFSAVIPLRSHALSDRQHQTKANGCISICQHINASIVHGSGMGPVAYLLNASYLRPIDLNNMIVKYTNDTYLIVPDSNIHTIPSELQHISDWATRHNLKLNETKSKKIIISLQKTHAPAITYLTRVKSLKVLGIMFNTKLCFKPHTSHIIQTAARCLYSLKTHHVHRLTGKALWDVTQATLIASIMYAATAWWGFLSVAQKDRIESVVKKAKYYGHLPNDFEHIHTLAECMESKLPVFNSVLSNPRHVLYHLLPPVKDIGHNL